MANYIALNYWELAAASVFVLINAGLSILFGLKVHRSLLVAAIRMVVQLALVGLVLTTLFSVASPLWTGVTALGMVLFAGHEAAQRQDRRLSGWWSYGLGTGCMMMSSVLVRLARALGQRASRCDPQNGGQGSPVPDEASWLGFRHASLPHERRVRRRVPPAAGIVRPACHQAEPRQWRPGGLEGRANSNAYRRS